MQPLNFHSLVFVFVYVLVRDRWMFLQYLSCFLSSAEPHKYSTAARQLEGARSMLLVPLVQAPEGVANPE